MAAFDAGFDWSLAQRPTGAGPFVSELLGQSPRHVFVGGLDLGGFSTGVGELVAAVGFVQVTPHPLHVRRDVVVTVLLSNDLEQKNIC